MTADNDAEFAPVVVEHDFPRPSRVFYKIDGLRVTLKEYTHGIAAWLMLPAILIHRLFRIPINSSSDDPTAHALTPFEIPQEEFPIDVYERMSPLLREMEELGFTPVSYHDINDGLQLTRIFLITLINPASPQIVGRVHLRIWIIRQPAKLSLFSEFISAFSNGTFLWTVSSKHDWLSPESVQVVRRPDLAPSVLLKIHEDALKNRDGSYFSSQATDLESARTVTEAHHATIRDFHLHRGVFTPRSESDQAQAMRVERLMHEGNPHAAVLVELEKLQQKRTSWSSAILILVVSLGLFIGVGAAAWSWKFLWMLLAILAFHELGHYIAMRAFGYRNLKMFFIPMLGAAVSGQNYTAPAWKKVLVALAGPLPGIIVGIGLGCAGWYYHQPLLFDVAVLTLIINGLNLLPVLPLDGGRVVHTLLFSRHYILDLGFRSVATAILLAAGFYTGDRVLQLLGFLLLLNIPSAYRMAKIASDLLREGVGPGAAADTFVPTDVATIIIDRLREKLNRNTSNKLIAQHALSVYETIATKRARWPATIGFAALHGFALLLVGASLWIFMEAQHGGFNQAARQAMRQRATAPKNAVASTTFVVQGRVDPTTLPAYTIVATLDNPGAARAVFAQITPQLGRDAALSRFGDSVILKVRDSSDTARKHWVTRLESYTSNLCVAGNVSQISMTLQCTAPSASAAKAIADELQAYLRAPRGMALIPPWSPADTRSFELRAKDRLARDTYQKLLASRFGHFSDPAFARVNQQTETALRHGDSEALKTIEAEQRALQQRLGLKAIAELRLQSTDAIDREFIDAYLSATDRLGTYQIDEQHTRELGARMGQLPMSGAQPADASTRFSSRFGYAASEEATLMIRCSFVSPFDAAPALVKWLEEKGCNRISYEFSPERSFQGDPSDEEMAD